MPNDLTRDPFGVVEIPDDESTQDDDLDDDYPPDGPKEKDEE